MVDGSRKHLKLRRFGRFCICSLVILAAVVMVANLTVSRTPAMPPASGHNIGLRGKEIHYVEQPGRAGRDHSRSCGAHTSI
jgi:hypothetical protein